MYSTVESPFAVVAVKVVFVDIVNIALLKDSKGITSLFDFHGYTSDAETLTRKIGRRRGG